MARCVPARCWRFGAPVAAPLGRRAEVLLERRAALAQVVAAHHRVEGRRSFRAPPDGCFSSRGIGTGGNPDRGHAGQAVQGPGGQVIGQAPVARTGALAAAAPERIAGLFYKLFWSGACPKSPPPRAPSPCPGHAAGDQCARSAHGVPRGSLPPEQNRRVRSTVPTGHLPARHQLPPGAGHRRVPASRPDHHGAPPGGPAEPGDLPGALRRGRSRGRVAAGVRRAGLPQVPGLWSALPGLRPGAMPMRPRLPGRLLVQGPRRVPVVRHAAQAAATAMRLVEDVLPRVPSPPIRAGRSKKIALPSSSRPGALPGRCCGSCCARSSASCAGIARAPRPGRAPGR